MGGNQSDGLVFYPPFQIVAVHRVLTLVVGLLPDIDLRRPFRDNSFTDVGEVQPSECDASRIQNYLLYSYVEYVRVEALCQM